MAKPRDLAVQAPLFLLNHCQTSTSDFPTSQPRSCSHYQIPNRVNPTVSAAFQSDSRDGGTSLCAFCANTGEAKYQRTYLLNFLDFSISLDSCSSRGQTASQSLLRGESSTVEANPPTLVRVELIARQSKVSLRLAIQAHGSRIVMDTAAHCSQRETKAQLWTDRGPRHSGRRYALLSLLAPFGVLAFVLSATLPGDDDLLQEFSKTSKSGQCASAKHDAVSSPRAFRIRTVRPAFARPTPQVPSQVATARVSIPSV
jgi:hypothetical protein